MGSTMTVVVSLLLNLLKILQRFAVRPTFCSARLLCTHTLGSAESQDNKNKFRSSNP